MLGAIKIFSIYEIQTCLQGVDLDLRQVPLPTGTWSTGGESNTETTAS